jgi:regulation of enolase protein 1 (concanavalin A-like superfamily)
VGTATVTMGAAVYVGLVVTSHNNGTLSTATFDSVTVTGGAPGNPPPTVSLTAPGAGAVYAEPATIGLAADAGDTGGGVVTQVEFLVNGTVVGVDPTAPYSYSWANVPAGVYQLTARATDDGGATTTSAPVSVTVTGAGGGLPSPWQHGDVGAVGVAGAASHVAGTYTVDGAGVDIWGVADGFHFVYQAVSGDVELIARVVTQENTDPWAKAGVMIREALTAGARHALMAVTPDNGPAFQRRTVENGTSTHTAGSGGGAPRWVRLVRSGNTVTGYTSTTGASWTQVGTATVTMGAAVYVGLVVTSHNNGTLSTATFDSVSVQ